VQEPLTLTPVVTSSLKHTITEADVSPEVGPPIDPSEHVAALVHEAVCKPTVLPATYTIQENIGDRISRLATPKPVKSVIIQPKIPQVASNSTSAQVSPAQGSTIDPSEHVAALVHEAVCKPTVLPASYTILEDIGDRISRLTTPKPVDAEIIPPKIVQPDSEGTSADTIEPQPIEAETKKVARRHPARSLCPRYGCRRSADRRRNAQRRIRGSRRRTRSSRRNNRQRGFY